MWSVQHPRGAKCGVCSVLGVQSVECATSWVCKVWSVQRRPRYAKCGLSNVLGVQIMECETS